MIVKDINLESVNNCFEICFCGDTVVTASNETPFAHGDCNSLFRNGLFDTLMQSDLRVFNIEAPITDSGEKIFKPGAPHLRSNPSCMPTFQRLKPCIFSCANNHIKDYGIKGIEETEAIASENEIPVLGVSSQSAIYADNACRITNGNQLAECVVYAIAENEFSIAGKNEGGANGYDALETFDRVSYLASKHKNVIVLFHAGRENYRYPSPLLMRECRKLIDCGASLVICQHSHCVGCYEEYHGGTIVYGQGNFIFDRSDQEAWQTGLVIRVTVNPDELDVVFLPVIREESSVSLADASKKEEIIHLMEQRSDELRSEEAIESHWIEFCNSQRAEFLLQGLCGIDSRLLLGFDRRTNNLLSRLLFRKRRKRELLLNFIRCESLRESLSSVLNDDNAR